MTSTIAMTIINHGSFMMLSFEYGSPEAEMPLGCARGGDTRCAGSMIRDTLMDFKGSKKKFIH